ncbi:MAG: PqqD family protein [Elusimicrobia bacterium]|nr:PqqD family protein [Elusimicrobiota bacterium]
MAQNTMVKRGSWKHSRRVAWRKVADEAVILDVETAAYFSLSGAGLRIWELLGKGRTVLEIAKTLAAEYDAPEDRLRDDCAVLVGRLAKEGLISRA